MFPLPLEGQESALLDYLRETLQDREAMLRLIANADFTKMSEQDIAELRAPLETGQFSIGMALDVQESCELMTNHDGESSDLLHWMRLYAVCLLFQQSTRDGGRFAGLEGKLGRLTESAIYFRPKAAAATLSFLCWLWHKAPPDHPRSFLALAIILLQLPLQHIPGAEPIAIQCEALVALVDVEIHSQKFPLNDAGEWIMKLDTFADCYPWYAMGTRLLEIGEAQRIPLLADICRRIST